MNTETINRLNKIKREDFIYVIFFVILILSYVANYIEKEYFINRSEEDKYKYYYLQIFIFSIVLLVNIYYVYVSYKEVMSLSKYNYSKRRVYAYLDFIASLAAIVASAILLYIAITDVNIDTEISL